MLVEFTVNNVLSIKESKTFSMIGSTAVKELEDEGSIGSNVFMEHEGKSKFLKSAVIYGANGSGKSNIITALDFFKTFILTSSNDRQADDEIDIIPFLLSETTENKPSGFEMIFIHEDVRYRYGYEVDQEMIHAEWLFQLPIKQSSKETRLFSRTKQEININARMFKEGKGIEANTRMNALFLSTVAQLNGAISQNIQSYFRKNFNVISGLNKSTTEYTISKFIEDQNFRKQALAFFDLINSGIKNIEIEETEIDRLDNVANRLSGKIEENAELHEIFKSLTALRQSLKKIDDRKDVEINLFYKKFNKEGHFTSLQPLSFNLESKGNQKLFALLGPWLDTIENGKVIIVDELDSRLHTLLTIELIKLFHSKANVKNAQLIFASHDTNLLKKELFRRDQIWFVEKDNEGASDLYSLVEYKINHATAVRNDASFEKDYLMGKYGAIPYFGDIEKFLNEFVYE